MFYGAYSNSSRSTIVPRLSQAQGFSGLAESAAIPTPGGESLEAVLVSGGDCS